MNKLKLSNEVFYETIPESHAQDSSWALVKQAFVIDLGCWAKSYSWTRPRHEDQVGEEGHHNRLRSSEMSIKILYMCG